MLERIRNNPRAATLLADVFDFDVTRRDAMPAAFESSHAELKAEFEPEIDERRWRRWRRNRAAPPSPPTRCRPGSPPA